MMWCASEGFVLNQLFPLFINVLRTKEKKNRLSGRLVLSYRPDSPIRFCLTFLDNLFFILAMANKHYNMYINKLMFVSTFSGCWLLEIGMFFGRVY